MINKAHFSGNLITVPDDGGCPPSGVALAVMTSPSGVGSFYSDVYAYSPEDQGDYWVEVSGWVGASVEGGQDVEQLANDFIRLVLKDREVSSGMLEITRIELHDSEKSS